MEGRFSVVRYVPDPARDEPINVGIVLQCGEMIDVVVRKDALNRAVTSDAQADESALARTQDYVSSQITEPQAVFDPETRTAVHMNPHDPQFLELLAAQSAAKVAFSSPRFIDIPNLSEQTFTRALTSLAQRLVRPLRARSVFAPVETPPRKALRQELAPWIESQRLRVDQVFIGKSGIPRTADFSFTNGSTYYVKHIPLIFKRESSLFSRAQSEAFEIEDARRGIDVGTFVPLAILEFAPDRSEAWVSQVKSIYDVVDVETFDASREMEKAIEFMKQHIEQ